MTTMMKSKTTLGSVAALLAMIASSTASSDAGFKMMSWMSSTTTSTSLTQRQQGRRLEEDAYFVYDLSQFSVRVEQCQDVRMYDDNLAADEDTTSPLAFRHFVVYRMCPSDACATNRKQRYDVCDTGGVYGKYALDLDTFLAYLAEYNREYLQYMCNNCNEQCNNENNNNNNNNNYYDVEMDCEACSSTCDLYQNLENYGYIDASELRECQQLENNNNGNDDGNGNNNNYQLYVGPRCSSNGRDFVLGVYQDAYCSVPASTDKDIQELLGGTLWYGLLDPLLSSSSYYYYSNSSSSSYQKQCLSCQELQDDNNNNNGNNGNQNDYYDADDVNELCENIYTAAAKCESQTGLTNGFIQVKRENNVYENQVASEFMSCTFIDSLLYNSYTQEGEINVQDPQDAIVRELTDHQKQSLAALGIFGLALLGLAEYFRRRINHITPPAVLATNGAAESSAMC